MQCYPEQLPSRLQGNLSPIYLVFGDDALLQFEAIEAVKHACRSQGFERSAQLTADGQFDWRQLTAESQSLSLFAQRQWIELELPNGNAGKEGGKQLTGYAAAPPDDQVLILFGPRLSKEKTRAKWFQALERLGTYVVTNTLAGNQFQRWLSQRAAALGVNLAPDGLRLLAEQHEGNLQAAAQELSKLALLYGNKAVSHDQLLKSLANQARYTSFQLADSLLDGDIDKAMKVLQGLQEEGAEPTLLVWQLNKEVQILRQLTSHGSKPPPQQFRQHGIWPQRQPLYHAALARLAMPQLDQLLERLAQFDLAYKTQGLDQPWLWLQHLCLMFDPAWQRQQALFDIGQQDRWAR